MIVFLITILSKSDKYSDGEHVLIWGSKAVSPSIPNQMFEFSDFAQCIPPETYPLQNKAKTAMDVLNGLNYYDLMIRVGFDIPQPKKVFCKRYFNNSEKERFNYAINNDFYVQYFVGDFPFWVKIGYVERNRTYIYTHTSFVLMNQNQRITNGNASVDSPVPLINTSPVQFTYSIKWIDSDDSTINRSPVSYQADQKMILRNSLIIIVFVIMISIILYILLVKTVRRKADSHLNQAFDDGIDKTYSWRSMHGDIFRPPSNSSMLTVFVGVGLQSSIAILFASYANIGDSLYYNGKPLMISFGAAFVASSVISGYFISSFGILYSIGNWQLLIIISIIIIFFPTWGVLSISSLLSSINKTSIPPSESSVSHFVVIALFYLAPLEFLGGYLGNMVPFFETTPFEPSLLPKKSKHIPIYLNQYFVSAIIGFSTALYAGKSLISVSAALTQFQFHFVFFSLTILIIVISTVSCASGIVYSFLLLKKDIYEWHWPTFIVSSSIGVFSFLVFLWYILSIIVISSTSVLVYCFIWGVFTCTMISLMCGYFGIVSAGWFIRTIFSNVKVE